MSTLFKSNTNECESKLPKIEFKPPTVGCEHFMSVVKRIRSEPNTLLSGLFDIIDNVYGLANILKNKNINHPITEVDIKLKFHKITGNLVEISISDNILHGFKSILEGGINSPLNMGHMRDGHNVDAESSEFGTGLKKAIIYLCNMATIYTRSIRDDGTENYVKVKFNINDMMDKPKPEESYDPLFKLITGDEFKDKHTFSHGSTISLTELNVRSISYHPDTGDKFSIEGLINYLLEKLSITYSNIIRNEVFTITLNGKKVESNIDLTEIIPETHKKQHTFYVKLNDTNDCEKIYRKGKTPTGRDQYCVYVDDAKNTDKFKHIDLDKFNLLISEPDVYPLKTTALTTFGTIYSDELHYDCTYVLRAGRQYDPFIKLNKPNIDGWSNHICNKIEYNSKKLNKVMGVGPNKQLSKSSNLLISAIRFTQQGKEGTSPQFIKYRKNNEHQTNTQVNTQVNIQTEVQPTNTQLNIQTEVQPTTQVNTQLNIQTDVQPDTEPMTEIILVDLNTNKKKGKINKSNSKSQHDTQIEIPIETQFEIQPEIQFEIHPETQFEIHPETQVEMQSETQSETQSENIDFIQENTEIYIINNQTNKIHDNLVKDSIEKIKSAAQIIMELIADNDFDRDDGYKVLDFVKMYVSNK